MVLFPVGNFIADSSASAMASIWLQNTATLQYTLVDYIFFASVFNNNNNVPVYQASFIGSSYNITSAGIFNILIKVAGYFGDVRQVINGCQFEIISGQATVLKSMNIIDSHNAGKSFNYTVKLIDKYGNAVTNQLKDNSNNNNTASIELYLFSELTKPLSKVLSSTNPLTNVGANNAGLINFTDLYVNVTGKYVVKVTFHTIINNTNQDLTVFSINFIVSAAAASTIIMPATSLVSFNIIYKNAPFLPLLSFGFRDDYGNPAGFPTSALVNMTISVIGLNQTNVNGAAVNNVVSVVGTSVRYDISLLLCLFVIFIIHPTKQKQ